MKKLILLFLAAVCLHADEGILRAKNIKTSVLDFPGCDVTGTTDSTACFTAALAATAGKALRVPSGIYLIGEIDIPTNIDIVCDRTAKLLRNGTIATGHAWIDIADGTGVTIEGCFFDGQTGDGIGGHATTQLIDRGLIASSTLISTSATFTNNSTMWVRAGSGFSLKTSTLQHSGGYPLILDARAANINDTLLTGDTFQYNRAFLFGDPGGTGPAAQVNGSWQGGVLVVSDSTFGVHGLKLIESTFKQDSGHGFFMDARNGNSALNTDFVISHNIFAVMGLDAIEMSGVTGSVIADNDIQRVGFVSLTDSDLTGTPRWYYSTAFGRNVGGVAIDHASLVVRETISGNNVRWINGTCIDGDGLGNAKIHGNTCANPMSGDKDFDATVLGEMGPGSLSIGVAGFNAGDTNGNSQADVSLSITDNVFSGLGCAIKMSGSTYSHVSGNTIKALGDSGPAYDHNYCTPISLIAITPAGYGAMVPNGNTITKNKITYNGSGMVAVAESAYSAAFTGSDVNIVYDNDLTGNMTPFVKDPNSGSASYGQNVTQASGTATNTYDFCNSTGGLTSPNCVRGQAETSGGSTSLNFYKGSTKFGTLADNGVFNIIGSGTAAIQLNSEGIIGSTYDFWGHSLSVGATQAAALLAAGTVISSARDSFFNSLFIGANGDNCYAGSCTGTITSTQVIDSSRNGYLNSLFLGTPATGGATQVIAPNGNISGANFYGFWATGSSQLIAQDTTSTGCTSTPCFNIGNVTNIVNSGAVTTNGNNAARSFYIYNPTNTPSPSSTIFADLDTTDTGCSAAAPCASLSHVAGFNQIGTNSTVQFQAPVGFGGQIQTSATALGSVSGGTLPLCLDGTGIRSTGCPASSGSSSAILNAFDYAFSQSPTTSLTAYASATITLNPSPKGVSGSATPYYLLISGASTTEPVLVTGGTCTSQASVSPSCTITFTPLHSYTSGTYTIGSDGGGIREADNYASYLGGATISMASTTYSIYSTLYISQGNTLIGTSAMGSIIFVPNGAFNASDSWVVQGSVTLAIIAAKPLNHHVTFANFTLNSNSVNQSAISSGTGTEDLMLYRSSYSVVTGLIFTGDYGGRRNGTNVNVTDLISGTSLNGDSTNNIIQGNTFHGDNNCSGGGVGVGWVFVRAENTFVADNYGDGACDHGYTANGFGWGNTFSHDTAVSNPNDASAHVAFEAEDSSRNIFSNNVVKGAFRVGFNLFPTLNEPATLGDNQVVNNYVDGALVGVQATGCVTSCGGTATPPFANTGLIISGNTFINCIGASSNEYGVITLIGAVTGAVVDGNNIQNNPITGGAGITVWAVDSTLSYASNLAITNNYINHNGNTYNPSGNDGIAIINNTGSTMPTNVMISGNIVTDTSTGGAAVQRYGLVLYDYAGTNAGMTGYVVSTNNFTGNHTGPWFISGTTLPSSSWFDPSSNLPSSGAGSGGANLVTVSATNPLLLYAHFRDDAQYLYLDYSRDYLNYRPVRKDPAFTTQQIRDPSVYWDGTTFWFLASGPNYIWLWSSTDLMTFSATTAINLSSFWTGTGPLSRSWAPEWNRNLGPSGQLGFFISLGTSTDPAVVAPALQTIGPWFFPFNPATQSAPTTGAAINMASTTAQSQGYLLNIFDIFPYYDAGSNAYYMQYVDFLDTTGQQFIGYAKSSTLTGTYTQQSAHMQSGTEQFGFGGQAEGPAIIALADSVARYGTAGCVRNYADTWQNQFAGASRKYLWQYVDSCPAYTNGDPFASVPVHQGAPVNISAGEHGTVIEIDDQATASIVYKAEDHFRSELTDQGRHEVGDNGVGFFAFTVDSKHTVASPGLTYNEPATIGVGGPDPSALHPLVGNKSYATLTACGLDPTACPTPVGGEAGWISAYEGTGYQFQFNNTNSDWGGPNLLLTNGEYQYYGAPLTASSLGKKAMWAIGENNTCFGTITAGTCQNAANNWFFLYNAGLGPIGGALTVANPGFEAGTTSSWTASGSVAAVTGPVHSGTYAASLGSNSSIRQTIGGLTSGQTYVITGWVQNASGTSTGVTLTVSDSSSLNAHTTSAYLSWLFFYQIGTQYTADSTGNVVITFAHGSDYGLAYLDDVQVYPIGGPQGAFPFGISPSTGEVRVNYGLTFGQGDTSSSNLSTYVTANIDSPGTNTINFGGGPLGSATATLNMGKIYLKNALSGVGLSSSVVSPFFLEDAGILGGASGADIPLASFGFEPTGNSQSLGIHARRNTTGSGWGTASVGITNDVDGYQGVGPGADGTNGIWIGSPSHAGGLGGVGIGVINPIHQLDVYGTTYTGNLLIGGTDAAPNANIDAGVAGFIGMGDGTYGHTNATVIGGIFLATTAFHMSLSGTTIANVDASSTGNINFGNGTTGDKSATLNMGKINLKNAISGVGLSSSVVSPFFLEDAGILGGTTGTDIPIASLGFETGVNSETLGIHARRNATFGSGSGWYTSSIGLTLDVDSSQGLGPGGLGTNGIWMGQYGVGIGVINPLHWLDVYGEIYGGYMLLGGSDSAPNANIDSGVAGFIGMGDGTYGHTNATVIAGKLEISGQISSTSGIQSTGDTVVFTNGPGVDMLYYPTGPGAGGYIEARDYTPGHNVYENLWIDAAALNINAGSNGLVAIGTTSSTTYIPGAVAFGGLSGGYAGALSSSGGITGTTIALSGAVIMSGLSTATTGSHPLCLNGTTVKVSSTSTCP